MGEHDDKIAIVTRCDGKVLDTVLVGEKVGDNWNLKAANEFPDIATQVDEIKDNYNGMRPV